MTEEEPTANIERKPDFNDLLGDIKALADFVIEVRRLGDDKRGHLAHAHASLMDAWADVYKHKAGLP